MPLHKIKTYYLLDLWAVAPVSEGFGYVVRTLRARGTVTNHKEVKMSVYLALVNLGLLSGNDEIDKATPKDWKRAKQRWTEEYSGSTME